MKKANPSKEGDAKPSGLNLGVPGQVGRAAVPSFGGLPFCVPGVIMWLRHPRSAVKVRGD